MAGFGDRFGQAGFITQQFTWVALSQVVSALMSPAFTVLLQDAQKAHPEQVLTPEVLAQLVVRHLADHGPAEADAARGGINAERFAQLLAAAKVRLTPADLAMLELRAQLTAAQVDAEARPQGLDPAQMRLLAYLAGDALGPDQLAAAVRRKIIPHHGRGAASVSYDQGIAESRLHDKWGPVLLDLTRLIASPEQLAEGQVRHFIGQAAAVEQAAMAGADPALLEFLTRLAGDAPGAEQLAVALRRKLIPRDGTGPDVVSFVQGIAEGRLADKYTGMIEGLAQLWPTPTDALDAQVKGQLTPAEGRALYEQLGGALQFHDWLLHSIGEGPTPLEAAILNARGIIPLHGEGPASISYDQAVRESRYRNKWTVPYRELSRHIPPPSTVASWSARNLITDQRAHDLLLADDMAPDLAATYIADAEFVEVSDYRGLQVSQVLDMFLNRLIERPQAETILAGLHVTAQAAKLMLDYADMRYLIDSINRSVQRIAQLFTARKIGVDTAKAALKPLGISPLTVDKIIETWQLQAAADVKVLTPAQITDAFHIGILNQAEAQAELQVTGYTAYDAWVLLSLKEKVVLPNKPKREVAAPPVPVIPGTT